MVKKTYKTFFLKGLNLLLTKKDGKRIEVVFRKGGHVDSTARFTTKDEDVQEAVEACKGFGRDYYIEKVEDDETANEVVVAKPAPEKKEQPLTDVKDVKRFRNIVEMRAAVAELGVEGVQEMAYLKLKAEASKRGYDYQIQK